MYGPGSGPRIIPAAAQVGTCRDDLPPLFISTYLRLAPAGISLWGKAMSALQSPSE